MPKISVIVPVYKVEPYLRRCVDSILGQTFGDFELILVDDGSPDSCGEICDDYASKDSRIHVIHQENGGLSAARNAGIDWAFANSGSEWFSFIDSDDWVHQDFLKILLGAAEEQQANMSLCSLYWTDQLCEDPDFESAQGILLDADQALSRFYGVCNCVCNKVIKRNLFRSVRFPVGKLYEDSFITHLLLCEAERIVIFREKMYYYYHNPDSITRSKWSDRKLDFIEAYELRLQFFKEHGYEAAYRRQKEGYVEELTEKIQDLLNSRESEEEHQETLRMLQEKLRLALKSARADGMAPFNRENLWCYLYAMKTDVVWKAARGAQKLYHQIKL